MQIPAIKSGLTMAAVLQHYHLKPDKNRRLVCPFHDDKTPSLQVYYTTHTAYCFSSNCKTHGKSLDVIDFIMHMEGCSKHEAILKAKTMLNGAASHPKTPAIKKAADTQVDELTRIAVLTKIYSSFKSGLLLSQTAKAYVADRCLDHTKTEVGYNSGQFHHGQRKNEALIQSCVQCGLLSEPGTKSRTGEKAYRPFGKWCIVFALRNRQGQITSLYYRSILDDPKQRHFYLRNRSGLYPAYPHPETKKLILTESIIDAATLQEHGSIAGKYAVLALYGTNGLSEEHKAAISSLDHLEEIIFFLNGDQAGGKAIDQHSAILRQLIPQVVQSRVATPQDEDINSLAQSHESGILPHLLEQRQPIPFFLSPEPLSTENQQAETGQETEVVQQATVEEQSTIDNRKSTIDNRHPHNLKYRTQTADYEIKGGIGKNGPDRLIISLHIIHPESRKKSRVRLDLYEDKQVEKTAREAGEKLQLRSDLIELDLNYLADLLDEQREAEQQQQEERALCAEERHQIPEAEKQQAFKLLGSKNLIQKINTLIGRSGVIGEENNRIFLFCIASSHKMPETLHALVQGSSGSGKTHIVRQITDFMPPENVIRLTRVTESSFYNYGEYDLQNKLVVIEDYDGLKEEAELAFRELQSNDELRSSVSAKDSEYGSYRTQIRVVKGPIGSMAATTRGAIYEDNLSRCFVLAVDESKEQTFNIIRYQNSRAAGQIDPTASSDIRTLLQNCIRLLKPLPVINPFAGKISLPQEAFKIRRLNSNFQCFVKQITLLNQYQREKDKQGRLITQKQDLQTAIEIMFDSIILKVDELDGSLRDFYEQLKTFVEARGKGYEFTQREVRQTLRISKTQMQRFINDLSELEYIERKGTGIHGATKYKISYWDDNTALKNRIKTSLVNQLKKI